MRLTVLNLLLLAIASRGFCEEVETNDLPYEEEEPGNEMDTRNDDKVVSENEVLITAPKIGGSEPKKEVGIPGQKEVPVKEGKTREILGGLKKVTKTIASGVKGGARKTASLTKKGVKAIGTGVKEGAKKTASLTKKGVKAVGKGLKGGAKKTASLMKKGVKAISNGVKHGAEALKKKLKNKRKD